MNSSTPRTAPRLSLPDTHKKRALQRALKCLAATALFLSELVVATFAGSLVALWAIPVARNFRGYDAIGGEWLLILFAAGLAYTIYHKWLFKSL